MNLIQEVYLGDIELLNDTDVNKIIKIAAFLGRDELILRFFNQSSVPIQTLANIAAARNNLRVINYLMSITEQSTYYPLNFNEICKYATKYNHRQLLETILQNIRGINLFELSIWAAVYGRLSILIYLISSYEEVQNYLNVISTILQKRSYQEFLDYICISYELLEDDQLCNKIQKILNTPDDFELLLLEFPQNSFNLSLTQLSELFLVKYGYVENGIRTPQQLVACVQAASGRDVIMDDSVDVNEVLRYSIKYGYDSNTKIIIQTNRTSININTIAFYAVVYNRRSVLEFIMNNYTVNTRFISDVVTIVKNQNLVFPGYNPSEVISPELIQDIVYAINHRDLFVYLIQESLDVIQTHAIC